jgi:hypothetical protein
LRDLLEDKDPTIQKEALCNVVRFKDQQSIAMIRSFARNPRPEIREWAAKGLGDLGDIGDMRQLRKMLNDESISVKRAAAEAVGARGREAIPDRLGFLESQDSDLQSVAIRTLANLGVDSAVPGMMRILAGRSNSNMAAYEVPKAIEQMRPRSILPFLEVAYESTNIVPTARWFAHYFGGGDRRPRVLCSYLARPSSYPSVNGEKSEKLPTRRSEGMEVLRILRQVWEQTRSPLVKEDIAISASLITTTTVSDWSEADLDLLRFYRDKFQNDPMAARAGPFSFGVQQVISRLETWWTRV